MPLCSAPSRPRRFAPPPRSAALRALTAPAPSARLLLRDGQKIGARFAFARGPFVQKINSQPPDPQSVEKLDRLEQAFLFERTIDIDTYDRHRDKLREELTLTQMDRHSSELEEMDVEGILAFAERVLPSAANLWVQSSFA